MKHLMSIFTVVSICLLASCGGGSNGNDKQYAPKEAASKSPLSNDQWFKQGEAAVKAAQKVKINKTKGAAKNVILFVGDGMGISTVTAARILEGQLRGEMGEENLLSFEKFPFSGLIKTYNTNQQTPDSAGTMTAIMTGVKTKAGVINIHPDVARQDCANSKNKELMTALDLAENAGLSTGIVSTARITHATPAATYSRSADRNWEAVNITASVTVAGSSIEVTCKDIAQQLAEYNQGNGIEVIFGGGRRNFLPKSVRDIEGKKGKRIDGKNYVEQWKASESVTYVEDQAGFDKMDVSSVSRVIGLFNSSHMRYEADRKNDMRGEPSLTQMTEKAINVLKKNNKGYFLMVESGRIDHGHHAGSAYNALTETIELSNAVKKAVEMTSDEDTLIIVTADHSHVFTIAGYPTRGNPILGKVKGNDGSGKPSSDFTLAADDLPYTTLGYANGIGYRNYGKDETNADRSYSTASTSGNQTRYNSAGEKEIVPQTGRKKLIGVDTQTSGYHQEALVPLSAETHAGEDVAIYARGPGAHLVTGTNEQNVIFHIMNHAADLANKAK